MYAKQDPEFRTTFPSRKEILRRAWIIWFSSSWVKINTSVELTKAKYGKNGWLYNTTHCPLPSFLKFLTVATRNNWSNSTFGQTFLSCGLNFATFLQLKLIMLSLSLVNQQWACTAICARSLRHLWMNNGKTDKASSRYTSASVEKLEFRNEWCWGKYFTRCEALMWTDERKQEEIHSRSAFKIYRNLILSGNNV